ncbi:hypothetical protein C2L64_51705 [Paraburkholderia hospita]|uniref:Uncharacterized protein n=1 Tax=Paraburkholderia hospita TaxID=169430 RepID=A0AAN1JNN1_9BURK|nr:hypothetical protein C2L64_51705 [Paraburkholderia hospita]
MSKRIGYRSEFPMRAMLAPRVSPSRRAAPVRDNLGHASSTTRSLYLYSEDDERHSETVKRHRMSWADIRSGTDGRKPNPGDSTTDPSWMAAIAQCLVHSGTVVP